MNDSEQIQQMLKRLVETTQDIFIFESLRSGFNVDTIKGVLRINTDRVTRVSKLLAKKPRKRGSAE